MVKIEKILLRGERSYSDETWRSILFDSKQVKAVLDEGLIPREDLPLVKELLVKMLSRHPSGRIPLADIAKLEIFNRGSNPARASSPMYSRFIKRLYLCQKIKSVFASAHAGTLLNIEELAEHFFRELKKSGDDRAGITLQEFKAWVDSNGSFSEDDIMEVFSFCDEDDGGDIDKSEFIRFLTTMFSHSTKA